MVHPPLPMQSPIPLATPASVCQVFPLTFQPYQDLIAGPLHRANIVSSHHCGQGLCEPLNLADTSSLSATNGAGPTAPARAPPVPQQSFTSQQGPMTPNGGGPSPAMDRNSPLPNGPPQSQGGMEGRIPGPVSSTNPKIAAQAAVDNKNIVRRKLTGYVGFANLPNQWHRKSVRKGFNFNVMVVGEYPNLEAKEVHVERAS